MLFRQYILLTAVAGLSAFLSGCGTVATYHPRSSTPPSIVSHAERIQKQKSLLARKQTEPVAQVPETETSNDSSRQNPQEDTPPVEFTAEILPVEFEPEPVDQQQAPGDAEPAQLPLPEPEDNIAPPEPAGLTLEQLESLALQHNPSIKQASASANKAAGLRTQVGLRPNPRLQYFADEMGNDSSGGLQGAALSQTFVTGGKLKANQCVIDQDYQSVLWEAEAQRYRVRTDVRTKFYQALAAQQRMILAQNFHEVAEKGRDVAQQRFDALEGAKPDVLQTEIQLSEVDIIRRKAEIEYQAAWKALATVVGLPQMNPASLEGELPVEVAERDFEMLYQQLLNASPELQAALARVNSARANLNRQDVQAVPNLTGQVGVGQDNFTGNSFANVQLSIPLPVRNRNQGNIQAAYADYCRATQDVARLKLAIRSRLVTAMQNYNQARITVEQYANVILPKAQESLNLSEQAHIAGQFGFLRVLAARRTYFETNLAFLQARAELATAEAQIDGLLLTGGLNAPAPYTRDDSLRGQVFSQQ